MAIIKHANPCGIAVGADIGEAHRKAHACDPVSAYGGVIAANREITVEMAEQVAGSSPRCSSRPVSPTARCRCSPARRTSACCGRCPGRRVGWRPVGVRRPADPATRRHRRRGDDPANWTLAAGDPADADTLADLEFAWRACRAVKSNAILLASGGASVGVGMGQVNRVDSAHLAVNRAGSVPRAASPPPTPSSRSPTVCRC